jgi:hypothetical protein
MKVPATANGVRPDPCVPIGAAQPAIAPVTAAAAVPWKKFLLSMLVSLLSLVEN